MSTNTSIFYVYAYLREDGTPYYIGKGSGRRVYSNRGRRIHKPTDPSRIQILEYYENEEDAFAKEIELIKQYGRKDIGTGILWNMTDGGEGTVNKSPETIEKIRQANTGKKLSDETKNKLREYRLKQVFTEEHKQKHRESMAKRTGLPFAGDRKKLSESLRNSDKLKAHAKRNGILQTGKKLSDETKLKISISKTNPSDEIRKRLSESHMGHKPSDATRLKMSEAQRNRKPPSDATRLKMSASAKLRESKKKLTQNTLYDIE
jgi:hypothetical protein